MSSTMPSAIAADDALVTALAGQVAGGVTLLKPASLPTVIRPRLDVVQSIPGALSPQVFPPVARAKGGTGAPVLLTQIIPHQLALAPPKDSYVFVADYSAYEK